MNKTIEIQVKDKIAKNMTPEIVYVCGNSDYSVKFAFDEDWEESAKTARFSYDNGQHIDVPFNGDECAFPKIMSANSVYVGVYAGDLRTSTDAYVSARKSTLSKNSVPAAPTPDVYNQIMQMINAGKLKGEAIFYSNIGLGAFVGGTFLTTFSALGDIGGTPRVGDLIVDSSGYLYRVKKVYTEYNACDLYCLACLKGTDGTDGKSILYASIYWQDGVYTTLNVELDRFNGTPRVGDLVVSNNCFLMEVIAEFYDLGYVECKGLRSLMYQLTVSDKVDIKNRVLADLPYYDGTITVIEDDTQ